MSIGARREYLDAIRERYKNSNKRQKGHILTEFCCNCLYSRKHAIRILNLPVGTRPSRASAVRQYGPELIPPFEKALVCHGTNGPQENGSSSSGMAQILRGSGPERDAESAAAFDECFHHRPTLKVCESETWAIRNSSLT